MAHAHVEGKWLFVPHEAIPNEHWLRPEWMQCDVQACKVLEVPLGRELYLIELQQLGWLIQGH